jgi:hypothetical protein
MNILDNISKEERLSYNIGNPKVMQELLHMLKPVEADSNAIVIGVIYRLLMVFLKNLVYLYRSQMSIDYQ